MDGTGSSDPAATPAEPRVRASTAEPAVTGPTAERPRGRAAPRDDADEDADVEVEVEDSDPEPVDPAEPVVSAAATANGATAEPTPRATANTPTRPT